MTIKQIVNNIPVIIVYHQKRKDVAFKNDSGKEYPKTKLRASQSKAINRPTTHFSFQSAPNIIYIEDVLSM